MIPTDLRYAVRRLVDDSRLTVTAVLTLSLGFASAVVMGDMLDRLLLRPPAHVADPDRVTRVYFARGSNFTTTTDYATVEGLERELTAELEHVAAYFTGPLSLGRGADARQVEVVAHSPRYFDVLGVKPELGSLAAATPDEPRAVISDGLWRRRFGGSSDVIGRPLRLGTDVYTIAAVLPRGFAGVDFTAVDVWLPLSVRAPGAYGPRWRLQPIPFLNVIALLRPGVDRRAAGVHATTVYRASREQRFYQETSLILGDLTRSPQMSETTRVALWIGGVSLIVLLIACGNVANLLYVRGLRRTHEMTVKVALGASRGRLMRGILVEAMLLSAAAGLVAFALVVTGGTLVRRLFLPAVAVLVSPLDTRLVVFTVAVCLGAAFLLGLLPALRLTTSRVLAPGQGAPPRSRLLDVFTGAQVALSVPLLVGAGLFVLSLLNAANQDFGFDARQVVVVRTSLYEIGEQASDNEAAHRAMQVDLSTLPQVEASAVVQDEPWRGFLGGRRFSVPGREIPRGQFTAMNGVDPAFFDVMRLRLVEGRFFVDAENRADARPVAVVSEGMARSIWPGESALGECLLIDPVSDIEPTCTAIVGVVGDARWLPAIRPADSRQPIIFVPLEQRPEMTSGRRAILVRAAGDPQALVPLLRERIDAAGRPLPYVEIRPFDETFEPLLRPWRLGATVFVVFGLLALAIAAVGVIVVTSDAVTQRSHELAVRAACGAKPEQLVRLVLARSFRAMLAGLAAGVAAAYTGARVLEALLFDVAPADLRIFGAAIAVLLGCALLAAWLPARRAGRVDPVIALHAE